MNLCVKFNFLSELMVEKMQNTKYNYVFILFIVTSLMSAQSLQLEFSSYIGGNSEDRAHGIAIDQNKNIFLTAPIQSNNFPVTEGALNTTPTGIYLAEINNEGNSLVFSTYLGISGGANYAHDVIVDEAGFIYIAGNTTNPNFPVTPGSYCTAFSGPSDASHGDAFLLKLNPDGNQIVHSTFIGGSGMDISGKLALDNEGNLYLIGSTSSDDFPVTQNAFDTTYNGGDATGRGDIFVAKFDSNLSTLFYCTYIGGAGTDQYSNNLLVDQTGSVYFAATTNSNDFPLSANAYDNTYNGDSGAQSAGDGVIVKLSADGSTIEFSTFIGGSGDEYSSCLAVDSQDNIYICGFTSSADFPLTSDAVNSSSSGEGFITKFNPGLNQILYSTRWNGNIKALEVTSSDEIIFSGITESSELVITENALVKEPMGSGDIFISLLDQNRNAIIYSTYFGGSKNDILSCMLINGKNIYICGNTVSTDFMVTDYAYDTTYNGGTNMWGGDAFIAKFTISAATSSEKFGNILLKKFRLQQNFPNPFNPTTNISYSLEEAGNVSLEIFDTLGQKLKTLVDNYQSTGDYTSVWNGLSDNNNPVGSGIYICRLAVNDFSQAKKLVLLQ